MSSNVQVLCPNKRRVNVKVNPGKTLQSVLEEACKKQGFDPAEYALTWHGRRLDSSLSFRLSGIPNNGTVETVKVDTDGPLAGAEGDKQVQIALQLPDGSRKIKSFALKTSLWELLTAFDNEANGDLLKMEGEFQYPACQYLTQEYIGKEDLSKMTLLAMGIKDRVLLRYTVKTLTAEKVAAMNISAEKTEAEKARLEKVFEAKKLENEERERVEAEREKKYEEMRQKEEEEKMLKQAIELSKQVHETSSSSTSESVSESQSTSNGSASNTTDAKSAATGSNLANRAGGSRLAALEAMLNTVDSSITTGSDLPWSFDSRGTSSDVTNDRFGAGIEQLARQIPEIQEFADFKFPEATKGLDLRSAGPGSNATSPEVESKPKKLCLDRQTTVYWPKQTTQEEVSEDFFEVTAQDVRKMQQLLSEEINSGQHRALVSESTIRQRNAERKKAAWKRTVVRIIFPDKSIVQAGFFSEETVETLYEFVVGLLDSRLNLSKEDFILFEPPTMKLDRSGRTLLESGLAPAATLYIRWKKETKALENGFYSEKTAGCVTDQDEAQKIAQSILGENQAYEPWKPTVSESDAASGSPRAAPGGPSSASGGPKRTDPSQLPKWMRGPKK